MMSLTRWLWEEVTWSGARHRRDDDGESDGSNGSNGCNCSEDPKDPKSSKSSKNSTTQPTFYPMTPGNPVPPLPQKSSKLPKTVSVTMTTTMTMTSTTSSFSTITTTSSTTTTSSSSTISSRTPTAPSVSTSSALTNQRASSTQKTTIAGTSQTVSTTSVITGATPSTSTILLSQSQSASPTISDASSISSSPMFTLSTSESPTIDPSGATPSTDGNRYTPLSTNTIPSSSFTPTASPAIQSSSPVASLIPNSSLDSVSGIHNSPSAGTLILIGITVGASAAIILALILLLCRRRTMKRQRERARSYNVPRPSNKRMVSTSQSNEYAIKGLVPGVDFAFSKSQPPSPNWMPTSQNQTAHSSSNPNWSGTSEVASRVQQFTAGGRLIPQAQPQNTMGAGLQRNVSSSTSSSQGTQLQQKTAVYNDQLPAFAARLQELGMASAGNNGASVAGNSDNRSTVTRYAAQPQLPQLDLSGNSRSSIQDPYGWFGSTISSSGFGSQGGNQGGGSHVSDYVVSPIEQQRQTSIQIQPNPWQVQLPVIKEARRGSKTSSHIDGLFDPNGNGVQATKAWNVSGRESFMATEATRGGSVPKWKDPLAWAREQRLQ